jgi:hypothetical protein
MTVERDRGGQLEVRDIGWAVEWLRNGFRLRRDEWPVDLWVEFEEASADQAGSKRPPPALWLCSGAWRTPWQATSEDLLAVDWRVRLEADAEAA